MEEEIVSAGAGSALLDHVLSLLRRQKALVKTVKNDDWLGLAWQMQQNKPFRSSLSLPPRDGKGMALFGRADSGCVGLVWDMNELNLDDDPQGVFCWPSGYYAKTEHNMIINRQGSVSFVGGRDEALCSLDDLREANSLHLEKSKQAEEAAQAAFAQVAVSNAALPETVTDLSAELSLSYNEVSLRLTGVRGVVALFVRTMDENHARFALGVRSLLTHLFPSLASECSSEAKATPAPIEIVLSSSSVARARLTRALLRISPRTLPACCLYLAQTCLC